MYEVYLDKLELPITPDDIQLKINGNNTTVNLINEGEVSILKRAGLTDVKFEIKIPHHKLPFSKEPLKVSDYLSKLELLKVNKKPFQFIVLRKDLYNTNMKVSIEDYTINEKASNGNMTVIDVKLKQFKDYEVVVVKLEKKKKAVVKKEKKRVVSKPKLKPYIVKRGDTLWAISKRFLGKGTRYPELARINKIKNPHLIYPKQVIRFE